MPRVLIVDNRSQYFIGNRISLARALVERGIDVHVATLTQRANDRATIEGAGVHYHPITSRFGTIGLVPGVARLVRSLRPDLTHVFTLRAGMVTSLASLAAPKHPLFISITGLGYTFISETVKARALRWVVRAGMRLFVRRRVTGWVFQNPDDREVFSSRLGVDPGASALVRGSGVDLEALAYSPEPADSETHVLFIGRMLWDKGIREFVEAARSLSESGRSVRFTAAGEVDPDNPSSVTEGDLATWRNIAPIEFVGFRDDIPELVASAHVVCLPSYREGLPKVLLEAGAVGRAVVATDVPGCREVVEDGVNGLLVPVRDAVALAAALGVLVDDADRRREMGIAGRQIVESQFSVDSIVAQLREVYFARTGMRL